MNIKKLQLKICKKYQSEFEQLQPDEMIPIILSVDNTVFLLKI